MSTVLFKVSIIQIAIIINTELNEFHISKVADIKEHASTSGIK